MIKVVPIVFSDFCGRGGAQYKQNTPTHPGKVTRDLVSDAEEYRLAFDFVGRNKIALKCFFGATKMYRYVDTEEQNIV